MSRPILNNHEVNYIDIVSAVTGTLKFLCETLGVVGPRVKKNGIELFTFHSEVGSSLAMFWRKKLRICLFSIASVNLVTITFLLIS